MDVVSQPTETGTRKQDLDLVCSRVSLGKEHVQGPLQAGKGSGPLVVALVRPVSHKVLKSLRDGHAVGSPAACLGVANVLLELVPGHGVKVEGGVNHVVAEGLVAEQLLLDVSELGRVGDMMLEKLGQPSSAPGRARMDLARRRTALWALGTFRYRPRRRFSSAACLSWYLAKPWRASRRRWRAWFRVHLPLRLSRVSRRRARSCWCARMVDWLYCWSVTVISCSSVTGPTWRHRLFSAPAGRG